MLGGMRGAEPPAGVVIRSAGRAADSWPRGAGERCRESSSGSCSSGFVALATTSVAMSMTRRPRFRAADLSCSNAWRGRIRWRSASTPMACSMLIRAVSACSSWPTVVRSRCASSSTRDRAAAPARAVPCAGCGRGRHRGLDLGRQLGGEQVGQHHRAGQVGQLVVADPPPVPGAADHGLLAGGAAPLARGPAGSAGRVRGGPRHPAHRAGSMRPPSGGAPARPRARSVRARFLDISEQPTRAAVP